MIVNNGNDRFSLVDVNGEDLEQVSIRVGWEDGRRPPKGMLRRLFDRIITRRPVDELPPLDLDLSVFICHDGRVNSRHDVICFDNRRDKSEAVRHLGDDLDGLEVGDNEVVVADLVKIPDDVDRIIAVVNLYEADQRGQHLGMFRNAFVRLVTGDGDEIRRYPIVVDGDATAMILGELRRLGGGWEYIDLRSAIDDLSLSETVARFA